MKVNSKVTCSARDKTMRSVGCASQASRAKTVKGTVGLEQSVGLGFTNNAPLVLGREGRRGFILHLLPNPSGDPSSQIWRFHA